MMQAGADEPPDSEMSLGARLLLGSVTLLIGILMVVIASPEVGSKKLFFYGFGAFCLLIALACLTWGRVRQFAGSVIGSVVFAAGIVYLAAELGQGRLWSESRAEPSALNAVLFLLFFGLPGVMYAWQARFGLRRDVG